MISREQKKEIIKQFCDIIGTGPDTVRSVQALDSQKKLPSHYINTNNLNDIVEFVIKWEDKYQLYITHNPIKTDSKGWPKEDNVKISQNIYLDVDCNKPDEFKDYAATENEYKAIWPAIDLIRGWLDARGFGLGYCDKTGNGIRFILPIPPYDVSDPEVREIWKKKIREFYNHIEQDLKLKLDSVQDMKRITGIPGTLNRKLETETRKNRMREPGEFKERVEDVGLFNHILSINVDDVVNKKPQASKPTKNKVKVDLSKLNNLIKTDPKLKGLYTGNYEGYASRSEAEMSLYDKLLFYKFDDDQIDEILTSSKIGKWKTAKPTYKEHTKIKAHQWHNNNNKNQDQEQPDINHRMTDTGNAKRLNDRCGENLRYCHGSKKWLIWDGQRWKEDNTGTIFKHAKESVEAIHEYADSLPVGDIEKDGGAEVKRKSDIKSKWQKFASSSESTAKLKAMAENLQSEDNIPVLMEDMDLNGWILPVQNGTIDLKTGNFRESRREDLCTKLANVSYDTAATCPTFIKFLSQIIPDKDTRRYIQECLGYALTGETTEENMFINYGTGSNGKSVLTDTMALLLGDYAVNVKASTLLTSNNNQTTPDYEIARMKGARLVTASEPKKGLSLSDDIIKTITNGHAKITARIIYQEPIEYYPTHKTFFSTNHKPSVSDHSRGVWRRLRLIPFVTSIEDVDQDVNLSNKLEKELPGILNWLIKGCLSWQKAGRLVMSDMVKQETDEYRADMDRLTEFLETVTTKGGYDDKVPNMWLRDTYNEWAERMGFKPMNDKTFSAAMSERDFKKVKTNGGYIHWRGLNQIITKIGDINKTASGEIGEDRGGLKEDKTTPGEVGEDIIDILKRYNNNGGSCDIEDIKKYIEMEVFKKTSPSSPSSPDDENVLKNEDVIYKMKNHYEGSKDTELNKHNLNSFVAFVIKEHPELIEKDIKKYALEKFKIHGVPA